MPIFKLEDTTLDRAQRTDIEREEDLEDWFENSPWALAQDRPPLWIGRQTGARTEGRTIFPDLLGIDSSGNLVIVEFKRDRTPREVVAQLLEYAAWANELSEEQIREKAESYFETRKGFQRQNFDKVFCDEFETDEIPSLNGRLRLFIVAGEIPATILSICRFLRTSYRMDVSCIEVSMFRTESGEVILSVGTRLGYEEIVAIDLPQSEPAPDDLTTREIVWKSISELTGGNPKAEFKTGEVIVTILKERPDFNENTIRGRVHLFRRSAQVVSEAILELTDGRIDVEFPAAEEIIKVVLRNHSVSNQLAIRNMVDLFRQSRNQAIQSD